MKILKHKKKSIINMDKSYPLVISVSTLLLLAICIILLGFWSASESSRDAIVINLSGKQRMLTQRMEKELLKLQIASKNHADQTLIKQDLLQSYQLFNQTMAMLDTGKFIDKNSKPFTAISAQKDSVIALIKQATNKWLPLKAALLAVVSSTNSLPNSSLEQALTIARRDNESLLQLMDSITGEIENTVHNKSEFIRMSEAAAIVLLLLIFGFILYHFRRQITVLSESKLLSMRILEKTGTAIVVINVKGDIELSNHAAEEMFGYLNGQLSGNNIRSLMDEPYAMQIGKRLNGEKFNLDIDLNQVDIPGHNLFIISLYDKTEQKLKEDRLIHLAYHDPLTELPNRILFMDRLAQTIARAHRNNELAAILFIDLDRFKQVNDTLGHGIGDLLLQDVASRLKACLREGDTLARLGGDEFTMIIEASDVDICVIVTQRILSELNKEFIIEGHRINISGSIGASVYPINGSDINLLLHYADIAMYQSKAMGGNTCCKYPVVS